MLYDGQAVLLGETLTEFADIFSKGDCDIGCFKGLMHTIDTEDAKPVKAGMCRMPLGFENEKKKHLDKMLETGVIQPSNSAYSSPLVILHKEDGGVRWCVDYRPLNNKTIKVVTTLPLIEECLDSLAVNIWFSILDMTSGYWQVLIDPKDCHKTAFIMKYGLFEHIHMAFGLCNAPSTFQRIVQIDFAGMTWCEVLAYLDNLFILGMS